MAEGARCQDWKKMDEALKSFARETSNKYKQLHHLFEEKSRKQEDTLNKLRTLIAGLSLQNTQLLQSQNGTQAIITDP